MASRRLVSASARETLFGIPSDKTGFCNAISVLILRRETSPLPVAKPTGFTTVAPR